MYACHNGHNDVVTLLMDHSDTRIDVNAKHKSGQTAFMFACANGHKDVVQLLLKYSEIDFDTTGQNLSQEMKDLIVNYHLHQSLKAFFKMSIIHFFGLAMISKK